MRFATLLAAAVLLACSRGTTDSGAPAYPHADVPPWTPESLGMKIAAVGDFGVGTAEALSVRDLVASWEPDHVITLGDNNYPSGAADTMAANVGDPYAMWIASGGLAGGNRFWPCTGNHDWHYLDGLNPYLEFFDLPGNERYYTQDLGEVQLWCLSTDPQEPDGVDPRSSQAAWLQAELAASSHPWKIVYGHHPPYSSGTYGDTSYLNWPFGTWGASLVLAGHEHDFERIERQGVTYVVQGLGGASTRSLSTPRRGSRAAATDVHGASLMDLGQTWGALHTVSIDGVLLDTTRRSVDLTASGLRAVVASDSLWHFTVEDPGRGWATPEFSDAQWATGHGSFGASTLATTVVNEVLPGGSLWLRHSFDVDTTRPLSVRMHASDGVSLYLNGKEVFQHNRSGAGGQPKTAGNPADLLLVQIAPEALHEGLNTLAAHVSLSDKGTAVWFDLLAEEDLRTPLVPPGSEWAYSVEPPQDPWREDVAGTTGWETGNAPLGWRVDDLASVITEREAGPPTAWFQTMFESDSGAGDPDPLLLEIQRPDGAIVWLNGVEIWRAGLPVGGLSAMGHAPYPVEGAWERRWASTLVDPGLLVDGQNVLSVQAHTASPFYGMRMDARLSRLVD